MGSSHEFSFPINNSESWPFSNSLLFLLPFVSFLLVTLTLPVEGDWTLFPGALVTCIS